MSFIVTYWVSNALFAFHILFTVFQLLALVIYHCKAKTMNGKFIFRLPYLYVDCVINQILCEPYIRVVCFLEQYLVLPAVIGYVAIDVLEWWIDYLNYLGCQDPDNCYQNS
jgi:hypothetical protein